MRCLNLFNGGFMKIKKRYPIIIAVVMVLAVFLLLMTSMMPPRGAQKDCDTSRGGKSIAINGHIMW